MTDKPKRTPRSILFVWMLVILLVAGAAAALFTALLVYYRITDVIKATDARLLMAAEMAREIVGSDYHDQIDHPSSISEEQYDRIVARNDDLCRRLHLQYLWSVLLVDDQLVFTSATHSDIKDPESPSAAFFEVHRDPGSFAPAMNPEMKPAFSTFNNEWGKGRQVLVPRKDELGRTYIFGASIQLTEYNAMIWQAVLAATAIGLAILGSAYFSALALVRKFTIPITLLTKTADQMTSGDLDVPLPSASILELQSLSRSFDRLRLRLIQRIKELYKSKALLDTTQRLTKVGGWEWDVAQQSMFWTDEAYRIHGFSPEQIPPGSTEHIQQSISCYDPADRPIIQRSFQDCIEKGLPYDLEVPFTNTQGEQFWVRTKAQAIWENDKIVRVVGNIMDITERKRAEEAISESEEKYRLLVENANDIVYSLTLDGVFTYVSPAWSKLLGHAISEVENHLFQIFIHPDDLPGCLEFLEKTITTGEKQAGIEYRVRHKDGTWRWHTSNSSTIHDASGKVVSFLGIARDITERKKSAEEQAYLSHLVDSSPASITIHDMNGKFLYANDKTFEMHGYSRDEFMKLNIHQLDVPESEAMLDARIRQIMQGGEASFEVNHFRKDGSMLPLHISARKTILAGEQVIESIAIDLTDRKQAEEQIRASKMELQRLLAETEHSRQALLSVVEDQKEADEKVRQINIQLEQRVQERTAQLEVVNRELESFAYSVSHDLRAPLRALDGFSAALISDYQNKLDDQGRHYLLRIQEASRRMGQLIEDLLNLSRISRRDVNLSRVNLSLLARQIANELHAQAPEQKVEYNIYSDLIVRADPNLIKIALENLLHNALKYSSKREVALIQVGMLEQSGERVFFVRDNGAGFDMAYADKLFTPFQRLHGSTEYPGTGIGLTIVQRIITRHGGRIWLEAAVNQGATVYFTLERDNG